ncbi:NACHT domain-containing protein [Actinomadura scrupuli]|uniref:NACHT domain-containing protein n=1 Tax=Actinomadura scrupuli TaxID=559629 RepID=UPI003D96A4CE
MRNVTGRRLIAMVAFGLLAAFMFGFAQVLRAKGLLWAANVSNLTSFVLALLIVLVPLVGKLTGLMRGELPLSTVTIAQAQDDLAGALSRQWGEEDRLRQLNDPRPLPVRWETKGTTEADADGVFSDIHSVFSALPGRRMVILGTAGAGKSALAIKLIREMLAARRSGDPVPILLPAGTWTADEPMAEWMADQLARNHPGLAVRIRTAADGKVPLTRALVDSGVVPIIDGLDELPVARRGKVIAEINAYGSDNPLVLTSRPTEYVDAVSAASRPVARTVVVELRPLKLSEVKDYLREATRDPPGRWRDVFVRLDAEPDGALATTLSTPLMVWLARTVYDQADPAELADRDRFAGREAIEAHLLAEFVPAVYRTRPRRAGRREFRCGPDQAARWLGFLASQLGRADTPDIAWWRLHAGEATWAPIVAAARAGFYTCATWWLTVWALTRRGYWRDGEYAGHGHYRDLLMAGPLGRLARPLTDGFVRQLPHDFDRQVDSFLRSVGDFGVWRVALITAALAFLSRSVDLVSTSDNSSAPQMLGLKARTLRRLAVRLLLMLTALYVVWRGSTAHHPSLLTLVRSHAAQILLLWVFLVWAQGVPARVRTAIDVSSTAGPSTLLRQDRNVHTAGFLAAMVAVGTTWLWSGAVFAQADAAALLAGILLLLSLGSTDGAWPRYLEARTRLTARRRLPWRTMAFLADAHRRGVLRQAGALYQFRHIRLQEQLAAGYSPWPNRLVPVVARIKAESAAAARRIKTRIEARIAHPRIQHLLDVFRPPPIVLSATGDADGFEAEGIVESPTVPAALGLRLTGGNLSIAVTAVLLTGFAVSQAYLLGLLIVGVLAVLAVRPVNDCRLLLARRTAGKAMAPEPWSVRVTPGIVELTTAGTTIRLAPDDVDRMTLRRVSDERGRETLWSAVYARLRHSADPPSAPAGTELPLYWLPLDTSEPPMGLVASLDRFAGTKFGTGLIEARAEIEACNTEEYETSGVGRSPTVSESLGILPIVGIAADSILAAILALTGQGAWQGFTMLAAVGLFYSCFFRLERRSVERRMPQGPWTIRVTPEAVELTVATTTVYLSSDDVTQVALRPVQTGQGSKTGYHTVQARLRPGMTSPVPAPDGWLTLCWLPDFSQDLPTELLAALNRFAGPRLDPKLGKLVRLRQIDTRQRQRH